MRDGNKIIGNRIGISRTEHNESQAELAAALGVKREMVAYWENGTRPIKAEMLLKIAERYNVSADYLLGLSASPTTSDDMKTAVKITGLTEKAIPTANAFGGVLSAILENSNITLLLSDLLGLEQQLSALERLVSVQEPDGNLIAGIQTFYDYVRLSRFELGEEFLRIVDDVFPSRKLISAAAKTLSQHGGYIGNVETETGALSNGAE